MCLKYRVLPVPDRMCPSIDAVILNWNLPEESIACAQSLLDQSYASLRLTFVDNGSTDGSVEILRAAFPDATVIALPENQGIAAGYNAGLTQALANGADYGFVLNNDTLFAPGTLQALVEAALRQKTAGVLMPKVVYESRRDTIWSAGAHRRAIPPGVVFIGLNQMDGPEYARERDIPYAPSCALLIPRRVLERVGLFDPSYFFYYDDWDYCERVRRDGWTIRYVPSAIVFHKVSLSTARSARPARWWYVMGRSTFQFYRRYYLSFALSLGFFASWFVIRETYHGNRALVPLFLQGLLDAVRGRPMRSLDDMG